MGTITQRMRKDGSIGYTAQVRLSQGGAVVFNLLNIPHVAVVTGHRSWASLQHYTHLRHTGNRLADWKWLEVVAPASEDSGAAEQ